jgi:hypothetical protein
MTNNHTETAIVNAKAPAADNRSAVRNEWVFPSVNAEPS